VRASRYRSGKLKGHPADGALHLVLHPLEQTAVVEEVSAGGQLPAVEQLSEADGAALVEGAGVAAEQTVELPHQFGVAAVFAERAEQHLDGHEGSVEDGKDPHVVEYAHFIEESAEEDAGEVVEVPDLDGVGGDVLGEFELVGGLHLVDVLVVVAQDVLL
jgi:hypothetical protein